MARLKAVFPISNEHTMALPVKELKPAIAFYQEVLGFSVVSRDSSRAILARDDLQIGLILKVDHDPSKAGSIAFCVDGLEAMHGELEQSGGNPGEFGIDEWDGAQHRTFFLRERTNGYCYCFYSPLLGAQG